MSDENDVKYLLKKEIWKVKNNTKKTLDYRAEVLSHADVNTRYEVFFIFSLCYCRLKLEFKVLMYYQGTHKN